MDDILKTVFCAPSLFGYVEVEFKSEKKLNIYQLSYRCVFLFL